mgnify:CR=1 FL=1
MKIDDFFAAIQTIDPNASRYQAIGQPGDEYTVFSDYRTEYLYADDIPCEKLVFVQIDLFTRFEKSRIFDKLHALLFASDTDISCAPVTTDFETDSRYIHHIFDVQVHCDLDTAEVKTNGDI